MELKDRIDQIVQQHGGLRCAARAIGLSPAYLSRLRSGEKIAPGKATLRKLRLRKIVTIEYESSTPESRQK